MRFKDSKTIRLRTKLRRDKKGGDLSEKDADRSDSDDFRSDDFLQ